MSILSVRLPLRKLVCVAGLIAAATFCENASAQGPAPFGFGFQPYGFYQPYGIQYRSTVPTPPYFAINPPVYYGARHTRPYGISPFAAPPAVGSPSSYIGHPAPASNRSASVNPYICRGEDATPSTVQEAKFAAKEFTVGKVQTNPFVGEETQLVRR